MPAKKLNDTEVQERLKKTPGWSLVNGRLHREFQCKDFVAAFGNMTRVALVAERTSRLRVILSRKELQNVEHR